MKIFINDTFEAAHCLPNVEEGHKCAGIHGHSWHVRIVIEGKINEKTGWVCDFDDVKKVWKPLWEKLDHSNLNDFIPNPTSELVATWIGEELIKQRSGWGSNVFPDELVSVTVSETPKTGAIWEG